MISQKCEPVIATKFLDSKNMGCKVKLRSTADKIVHVLKENDIVNAHFRFLVKHVVSSNALPGVGIERMYFAYRPRRK